MQENMEYKKGVKWANQQGNELRVMGVIDGYVMLRYKGMFPFIKPVNRMPTFLKFIQATEIK